MPDRTTWTAPVTGKYHFSAFGTPHLVAECGPHCTSYLDPPEGTTVIAFDTSPVEYAAPERPGLIEAPANMGAEQIAKFQAAWDAMMQEPAAPHVVRQRSPRLVAPLRRCRCPDGCEGAPECLDDEGGPLPEGRNWEAPDA